MIKLRMACAGHIACKEEMGNINRVLVRKWDGKNHLDHLDINLKVILKWKEPG
jgi:hypothetical protein